ncbi:MAG: PAS domain-containing protein [Gammaproteobacteria bacterium]|nr:PAS domain-containing protein [Gammaproteobacteria bacterium]NIR90363.1 PAS domain-containing protein [Gammaproteobacteria bacterium]NIU03315.1 PAS domain-containing protein [Gammaproteobacteria bacterium]NIV50810.1 PAS domain-containing protein [Gammaproteobacteria bacterium]NIW85722.1 PAS domain-containing protein [Gammaproteobacteria bacterium]
MSKKPQSATASPEGTVDTGALLQAGLDRLSVGFGVFDAALRLLAWNAPFQTVRGYPPDLLKPGLSMIELLRLDAERSERDAGDVEERVHSRIDAIRRGVAQETELTLRSGIVLRARYDPIAGGGVLVRYTNVTDTQRALQALRESEERYALVSEAAEEGLYDWRIDRDEIYVSPRLDRFFKFEVGELGPKDWNWNSRIHPDDVQHYLDTLQAHFRGEIPRWQCEYRFRDKEGGYRWILDHGYTVRNERDEPLRLVGAIRDITDRKQVEEALRESEARYALAMRAINEGVYDWDIANDAIYYSERVYEALDLPRDELTTPRDWLERIHPDDVDDYRQAMIAHFKGETDRFEHSYRYRDRDGNWRWALQHGIALRDDEGRAYRMIGSTGDITELKESERELAEKTAILETTLENIDQGITMVDKDLHTIALNSRFLELLEFPPERFKSGFHMEEAFRFNAERGEYGPGDVEEQVRERVELAKRFESHAFERTRPDGTVIAIRGKPLPGGGFVSTYTDITERKRAEEALRESEERYAVATRAATEGIYDWNVETGSLHLSERAKEFFGFPQEPLTPASWNAQIHPEDFEGYRQALVEHFKDRTPHLECEYRIRDAEGGYRWILDRGIGVRNEAGRVIRLVGAVSDITARKLAELELRRAHRELEEQNQRLREEIEAHRRAKATIEYLVDEIESGLNFGEIVGNSPSLKELLGRVELVAATDSTVLIQGETGTGKELIARAIHSRSPRGDQPLVKVNCAALPRELVESELFGHEKGAFTGATQQRKGRFELAHKGTLFLDEVGELPLEAQVKLLRVLQEGEFERVGGTRTLGTDVRVLAATNRDLASEVEAGRFRSDLFYRLNVFPVTVPPLRERRNDIPLLARHFMVKASRQLGKPLRELSPAFLEQALAYAWPGNIRELENVVMRGAILSPGPLLELPESLPGTPVQRAAPDPSGPSPVPLRTLEAVERDHIQATLEHTQWVVEGERGAAALLGLNPSTLRGRMRKLGIRKPR